MEASGHIHAPAALPLRKETPVPIRYQTGLAPEPAWALPRKNRSFSTRRYTTRAIILVRSSTNMNTFFRLKMEVPSVIIYD
jgi:hypothetical protein